eukprot:jgi/Ulvmu1/3941/UM018_0164.1
MRALDLRLRVAIKGVVAAGRLSATVPRFSDDSRGGSRLMAESTLPSMVSIGAPRVRTTGSIVPAGSAADAIAAAASGGSSAQTWDKQMVAEGLWDRADGGLDTVEEGEHR